MINRFHKIALGIEGAEWLGLNPDQRSQAWPAKHRDRYADSWLYLLRATRNDRGDEGYLISRDNFTAGLGYRNGTVFLVRPQGHDIAGNIRGICHYLQWHDYDQIVIKKIDKALGEALMELGEFDACSTLNKPALLEDEAFPEFAVDLTKLFPKIYDVSPRARNLRRKLKKFEAGSSRPFCIGNSGSEALGIAEVIRFLGQDQEKRKAYSLMVKAALLGKQREDYITRLFHDSHYNVEGVYIGERLNAFTAGLYCAVTSRSGDGITEWMDACFFRQLYSIGIKQVLLGGCETAGVVAYCKKLLVEETSYCMIPLVLRVLDDRVQARSPRATITLPEATAVDVYATI